MDRTCAKCRLSGQKLFLKGERCFTPKCPFTRRSYAPGIHGQGKHSKPTNFGTQLREKQRVKWTYGMRERQFHNLYEEAMRKPGNTGDYIATILEMRLDNILYLLGIGKSHDQARQIITHNHILVNGKRLNVPSYRCRTGDKITLKRDQQGKAHKIFTPFIEAGIAKQKKVAWLNWDEEKLEASVLREPLVNELPTQYNMKAIVEFYSR